MTSYDVVGGKRRYSELHLLFRTERLQSVSVVLCVKAVLRSPAASLSIMGVHLDRSGARCSSHYYYRAREKPDPFIVTCASSSASRRLPIGLRTSSGLYEKPKAHRLSSPKRCSSHCSPLACPSNTNYNRTLSYALHSLGGFVNTAFQEQNSPVNHQKSCRQPTPIVSKGFTSTRKNLNANFSKLYGWC